MSAVKACAVRIEKMRKQDLDQVIKIENDSFSTPWSRQAFLTELKNNDFAHYYVAKIGQEVIGYAGMWIILDEAHVTTIAIAREFRKQNFGKLLMKKLMEEAIYFGADKITLEVRPSNTAARTLYKRLGFKPVGLRKEYYLDNKEDALIMWRSLRS